MKKMTVKVTKFEFGANVFFGALGGIYLADFLFREVLSWSNGYSHIQLIIWALMSVLISMWIHGKDFKESEEKNDHCNKLNQADCSEKK